MIAPFRGSNQPEHCVADAELLFALHRQGVFRYLCRVVGRPDTAQDLTQEVFLRVTRARVPDADASGHRAWVFKIARNLALNHMRDGDQARRERGAGGCHGAGDTGTRAGRSSRPSARWPTWIVTCS